jgi:hypothetical protein
LKSGGRAIPPITGHVVSRFFVVLQQIKAFQLNYASSHTE